MTPKPNPPYDSRAARLLRQKQRVMDLTQKALGRILGVAPNTAQAIADGYALPRIDVVFTARTQFGIPVEAWPGGKTSGRATVRKAAAA